MSALNGINFCKNYVSWILKYQYKRCHHNYVSLVFADGALYALLTADIAKVFSEEPSGAEIRISHRHDVHSLGKRPPLVVRIEPNAQVSLGTEPP